MSTLSVVILQILICLSISLTLVWLIKPLLRDVLIETCGTQKRADFWLMFSQIMLVIAPLLIVVYFIPTSATSTINLASELKGTLFQSLLGNFIALASIGHVMWKSIQQRPIETNTPIDHGALSEA